MTDRPDSPAGTAFCTVLNDDYLVGFLVLCHSLRRVHPDIDLPFVIIHHPELAPLSESSRDMVSKAYPRVEFHAADAGRYENVWANRDGCLFTPPRLRSAFFLIEAFSLSRFERVITLDSDMICVGDLTPLFNCEAPLAAVPAKSHPGEERLDYFNSGTLVIGREHLDGKTYRALLAHRISAGYQTRKGKADQAILNDFFDANSITELDEAFNSTKRKYPDQEMPTLETLRSAGVSILHYVGEKPWQEHRNPDDNSYSRVEAIWWEMLGAAIPHRDFCRLFRIQQARLLDEINNAAFNLETPSSDLVERLHEALHLPPSGTLWNRLFPNRRRVQAARAIVRGIRRLAARRDKLRDKINASPKT